MRLRPTAFGEFVVFPEVDEFFGRDGFVSSGSVEASRNLFCTASPTSLFSLPQLL